MSKDIFIENLRALIKRDKLSYARLGEAVGLSRQAICDYCNGKAVPKSSVLIKLAEYFAVSPEYLLTGVEKQNIAELNEIRLSGSIIKNLKASNPNTLNFINAMLADSDFYAAIDKFYNGLNTISLQTINQLNDIPQNLSAMNYAQTAFLLSGLDGSLSFYTQELAGYFKDLAIRGLGIKTIKKLIEKKLAELQAAAPSDAQA